MPWTAASFKARHNKKLTKAQAKKAARIANAMIASGADEGMAIATANKQATKKKKRETRKQETRRHEKRSRETKKT